MPDSRASYGAGRAAALAVVACTVLLAALAVWAASIGPQQVVHGEGRETAPRESPPPTTLGPVVRSPVTPSDRNASDDEVPFVVKDGVSALLIAVPVVALVGLVILVRVRQPRQRRHKDVPREGVETDALPPVDVTAVAAAIADDAAAQHQALMSGTPRNAIVQCWHRFEVHAASAGERREAWETSSEFTERVLTVIGADPRAVAGLAELFREARFSRHEVTEELRDQAIELLDRIQASLRTSGARP